MFGWLIKLFKWKSPDQEALQWIKQQKKQAKRLLYPFESVLTVNRERGKTKSGDAPPAEGETHAPPEIDTKGWLS